MAKTVYVEKVVRRTKQAGVNYLIADDPSGEIRFNGKTVLRGADMDDPAAYGTANANALFAAGELVADGQLRIENLREGDIKDIHDDALRLVRQMMQNNDDLGDIIDAVLALYNNHTRVQTFMTDAYTVYNRASAAQQRQFNVMMFYLLVARG